MYLKNRPKQGINRSHDASECKLFDSICSPWTVLTYSSTKPPKEGRPSEGAEMRRSASSYHCMYVASCWPGFGPNPQNERNSCNKETKTALSEHWHPNAQHTFPSSLHTHLVTCLPSFPVEALVSACNLFLPSCSQHRSQPTTTCIPMVITIEALYTVNWTISPSATDVFFFWSRTLISLIFSYKFTKQVSLMIWYVFPQCAGRTNILNS